MENCNALKFFMDGQQRLEGIRERIGRYRQGVWEKYKHKIVKENDKIRQMLTKDERHKIMDNHNC